jgi:hypothetical protein
MLRLRHTFRYCLHAIATFTKNNIHSARGDGQSENNNLHTNTREQPVLRIRIRCLFDPWTRIPVSYFLELREKFLCKKFYNYLKTRPNFFLQHFKNKIIFNFVRFVATKKGITTNFFSPLSFVEVFGSGIRDPGSGIRDPGSGMGKKS